MVRKLVLLITFFIILVILRVSAPMDILDGSQPKQVSYCMDILHNSRWLIQFEADGQIATKPPLYNWISASLCQLFHSTSLWIIKMPSLLAGLGLLILVYLLTLHWSGNKETAFYSTLICLTTHIFCKHIWFCRTDMLMTLTLYLGIYCTIKIQPSYWKPILVASILSLSALSKGPVGPILFAIFLLAYASFAQCWKNWQAWKYFTQGFIFFSITIASWLLAVWPYQQFHHEVLERELLERVFNFLKGVITFYIVPWHTISQFLPWTILAFTGFYFLRKKEQYHSIFQFFIVFLLGMIAFTILIPSHRTNYVLPFATVLWAMSGMVIREWLHENTIPIPKKWIFYVAGSFFLFPAAIFFLSSSVFVTILALGSILIAGGLFYFTRESRFQNSFYLLILGMIVINGLYHHWLEPTTQVDYKPVQQFATIAKEKIGKDSFWVWKTNPMIFYEMNVHPARNHTLTNLKESKPAWIISPDYHIHSLIQQTGWNLKKVEEFRTSHKKYLVTAGLYKVE